MYAVVKTGNALSSTVHRLNDAVVTNTSRTTAAELTPIILFALWQNFSIEMFGGNVALRDHLYYMTTFGCTGFTVLVVCHPGESHIRGRVLLLVFRTGTVHTRASISVAWFERLSSHFSFWTTTCCFPPSGCGCVYVTYTTQMWWHSKTCLQRPPIGAATSGLIMQVIS